MLCSVLGIVALAGVPAIGSSSETLSVSGAVSDAVSDAECDFLRESEDAVSFPLSSEVEELTRSQAHDKWIEDGEDDLPSGLPTYEDEEIDLVLGTDDDLDHLRDDEEIERVEYIDHLCDLAERDQDPRTVEWDEDF